MPMCSCHGSLGHRAPSPALRIARGVCTLAVVSALAAPPAGAATNGLLAFEATSGLRTIETIDPVPPPDPATALATGPLAVPGIPVDQGSANPAWSPDGTQLAYSSRAGGSTDIYVVNANDALNAQGTTPVRITRDPAAAIDPAWSPDGRRIAFTSLRSGVADIYVVDIASGALQRLTTDPGPDEQADWSPDGTQIAFQSRRAGSEDIWLMSSSGANQRPLTSAAGEESDPEFKPDDGSQIAFSAGPAGGDRQIYAVATSGGALRQLTSLPGRNTFPAWSPDAKQIALTSGGALVVIPASGATAAEPARQVAANGTDPTWAILPVPAAKTEGDVKVRRPKSTEAEPVASGATVALSTGTVVDTTGGGTLTLTVNRQAVSASTPDSTATITDAVVRITERTPEALGLRISRPDCSTAEVVAAKSNPRKARLRTRSTRSRGNRKKAQVKPSTPEGHMSSRDTDYGVVVTCNGTYVRVREGVVLVQRKGKRRAVRVRGGTAYFIPRAR